MKKAWADTLARIRKARSRNQPVGTKISSETSRGHRRWMVPDSPLLLALRGSGKEESLASARRKPGRSAVPNAAEGTLPSESAASRQRRLDDRPRGPVASAAPARVDIRPPLFTEGETLRASERGTRGSRSCPRAEFAAEVGRRRRSPKRAGSVRRPVRGKEIARRESGWRTTSRARSRRWQSRRPNDSPRRVPLRWKARRLEEARNVHAPVWKPASSPAAQQRGVDGDRERRRRAKAKRRGFRERHARQRFGREVHAPEENAGRRTARPAEAVEGT